MATFLRGIAATQAAIPEHRKFRDYQFVRCSASGCLNQAVDIPLKLGGHAHLGRTIGTAQVVRDGDRVAFWADIQDPQVEALFERSGIRHVSIGLRPYRSSYHAAGEQVELSGSSLFANPGGERIYRGWYATELLLTSDPADRDCRITSVFKRQPVRPDPAATASQRLGIRFSDPSSFVRVMSRMTDGATGPIEDADLPALGFTAIASTETPAMVWDYANQTLVYEVLVSKGGEFPGYLPLCNGHATYAAQDVIGSAQRFELRSDGWHAHAQLVDGGPQDPATLAWDRVKGGHIRGVSIGYRVQKWTMIPPGESQTIDGRRWTAPKDYPLRISQRWVVHELSLVPIGADPLALITSVHTPQRQQPKQQPKRRQQQKRKLGWAR